MKNIIKLIFVLFAFHSFSQGILKADSSDKVLHYENELIVRTFLGIKNLDYRSNSPWFRLSRDKAYYDVPSTLSFGVGAHSEFIGFHLWFNSGKVIDYNLMDDNRLKYDFQVNLYTKRFVYDLNFQYYKGLYYHNETNAVYNDSHKLFHLGGVVLYAMNEEFSVASSFTQISKQIKSQGSVLLFTGLSYSDISLVSQFEAMNFSLGAGYGYNLVYKDLFLSFLLAGAPAIQRSDDAVRVGVHLNSRVGLGYNTSKWVYGITFVDDSQLFEVANHYDRLDKYHVKLFLGYI